MTISDCFLERELALSLSFSQHSPFSQRPGSSLLQFVVAVLRASPHAQGAVTSAPLRALRVKAVSGVRY